MLLPEVVHLAAACIICLLLHPPYHLYQPIPPWFKEALVNVPQVEFSIILWLKSKFLREIPIHKEGKGTSQGGKRSMQTMPLNMSSGTVAYISTNGLPSKTFTFCAKESSGSYKVQHSAFADSHFTKQISLPVTPHWQFTIWVQCLHWTAACQVIVFHKQGFFSVTCILLYTLYLQILQVCDDGNFSLPLV